MKSKYIDIHAHMNFPDFKEDRKQIIQQCLDDGVYIINIGTSARTSNEVVRLANEYEEGVYACIGLHPIHIDGYRSDEKKDGHIDGEFENFNPKVYKDLLENPKVVGIGECGLDYFHIKGDVQKFKEHQQHAFRQQIELAIEYNKPLMIHCRDAYPDTLNILKEYRGEKLRGNVHFFVGSKKEAQEFMDLEFTLSFTGVITFTDSYEEVVKMVPLNMMHVETDCPYVAPASHRGKRNQPDYVKEIVKKIAEIKGESEEKVREVLRENAKRVFGI